MRVERISVVEKAINKVTLFSKLFPMYCNWKKYISVP